MNDNNLSYIILNFLEEHSTLSLATSAGGIPWAASLFYANRGFTLYFLSKPDSRHCENLTKNPCVSATINEDHKKWRDIRGIQLEGQAYRLEGAIDKSRTMNLYLKKYPFVKEFLKTPHLQKALLSVHLYKIIPTVIHYIDNTGGYFNRQTLDIKEHFFKN